MPRRDAIALAGGFRLVDGFISPLDLIEIGLLTGEEAAELHTIGKGKAAPSPDPTAARSPQGGFR